MKKIVSSLLVTVGSLGILAGIAGAVYALGRNGSKIREWITGESSESSSNTERPPASSESGSSSSGPTSSSSSELPAEVPYNDPSKPLGITVGIEPFEYYHETGTSPITVPIDVYTTGWESGGEATINSEIVGMGGQAAGDLASRLCVEAMVDTIEGCSEKSCVKVLSKAIRAANRAVVLRAGSDPQLEGMGTTLVAATPDHGCLYVANVGDSRLYILDDDRIEQITHDHSLVEEMVRAGKLRPE